MSFLSEKPDLELKIFEIQLNFSNGKYCHITLNSRRTVAGTTYA